MSPAQQPRTSIIIPTLNEEGWILDFLGSLRNQSGRRLDTRGLPHRFIDRGANTFSRLPGIATGDQALFRRRLSFDFVGTLTDHLLLEDRRLCRRVRLHGRLGTIQAPAIVTARRFHPRRTLSTVWTNLKLTRRFFRGEDPRQLFMEYYVSALNSGPPARR